MKYLLFFLLLLTGCAAKPSEDSYPIFTDYGNGVLLFNGTYFLENISQFRKKDARDIISIEQYYNGTFIVIVENTPEKPIR